LRARGVVLISGGRGTKAFDIYTDRKLRYGLRDGGPDPDSLQSDRANLCEMITATMESWHGRKISPVYQLIPNLIEPDWRTLRIGNFREFWEAYDAWEEKIIRARAQGRVGDMLVLADEAPVSAFRASAWIRAGKSLRRIGHYGFALEQLDKGLAIEPENRGGLREKGMCLQRLALQGQRGYPIGMARSHYRAMLQKDPRDAETWALLGRVEKDAWVASWRLPDSSPQQRIEDARYEDALLRAAIECYETAFRTDPKHYYSGINALALMHLYGYLNGEDNYRDKTDILAGAVRFAAQCEVGEDDLYWARASLGDLEVLVGTPQSTQSAYKEAVVINRDNWFALDSSRSQLLLLQDLGFSPANVDACIAVFYRELSRLPLPGRDWEPRRVFLFSGHMVDAPDRETPRLPEDKLPLAAEKIMACLRELDAGPDDLALTQGACGGDLLFTEACQSLGVRVSWLQPFDEPDFIRSSVVRCSEHWRQRYLTARQKLGQPVLSAVQELGEPPEFADRGYAYERCNRWLLYTALAWGVEKVHFICLWNGAGGDGPGGTAHMYESVARRTGQVHWIDTRTL
jgi:tetratricopeptide (TPR) repeat protein